jgi:hypothetical protein
MEVVVTGSVLSHMHRQCNDDARHQSGFQRTAAWVPLYPHVGSCTPYSRQTICCSTEHRPACAPGKSHSMSGNCRCCDTALMMKQNDGINTGTCSLEFRFSDETLIISEVIWHIDSVSVHSFGVCEYKIRSAPNVLSSSLLA